MIITNNKLKNVENISVCQEHPDHPTAAKRDKEGYVFNLFDSMYVSDMYVCPYVPSWLLNGWAGIEMICR